MEKDRNRKKIMKILDHAPELKKIMLSSDSLEEKRKRIRYFLADTLMITFEDNPAIPPLEWILVRNTVNVFRGILSMRSERLAGHSLLRYINDIVHKSDLKDMPSPGPGFFAELEHLMKGIVGKTGIYHEKIPTFLKYDGRKAASLRSADLSRMALSSEKFMNRYACGDRKSVV